MGQLRHFKNVHLAVIKANIPNSDQLEEITLAFEEALSHPIPLTRHEPNSANSRCRHVRNHRSRALASDFTQTLLLRHSSLVRASKTRSRGDGISQ